MVPDVLVGRDDAVDLGAGLRGVPDGAGGEEARGFADDLAAEAVEEVGVAGALRVPPGAVGDVRRDVDFIFEGAGVAAAVPVALPPEARAAGGVELLMDDFTVLSRPAASL